jgi:hypothetical protein
VISTLFIKDSRDYGAIDRLSELDAEPYPAAMQPNRRVRGARSEEGSRADGKYSGGADHGLQGRIEIELPHNAAELIDHMHRHSRHGFFFSAALTRTLVSRTILTRAAARLCTLCRTPVAGEWDPRMLERLDEEELADWRAGRNAVYQLAALTIGARLAVADA